MQSSSTAQPDYNENEPTNIPATIDDTVLRWYSGLNQIHDVILSQMLIFWFVLCFS